MLQRLDTNLTGLTHGGFGGVGELMQSSCNVRSGSQCSFGIWVQFTTPFKNIKLCNQMALCSVECRIATKTVPIYKYRIQNAICTS